MKKLNTLYKHDGQDRLLPRLSLAVYDHFRIAAIVWALLVLFGAASYGSFLKREGFPAINIPITVISGTYLVNDPAKVDREVAKPISDELLKDDRVSSVQTQSRGAFFVTTVQYDEGVDSEQAGKQLEERINQTVDLPEQVSLKVESPKFGFTERGDDVVISVFRDNANAQSQTLTLEAEADELVRYIESKNISDIESISTISPFVSGVNPATGQQVATQSLFDRYGERKDGNNQFYESVSIGVMQSAGSDVIKLDDKLLAAVDEFNQRNQGEDIKAVVSASYANDIKSQISELQTALLEGLIAVLFIGSLVIAVRASLITVISMITVLAITVGILFLIGYSLNTITLFSLILCLGLIVDDTIIMVEALDAQRRRRKDARETVKVATQKVSRAMVAATSTAALSFAPLLFVGGILGGFIRAIPVTVITSLIISLVVALVFIPLFARYLLLGKKQMGAENVHEPAANIEARIANFIGKPMLKARDSKAKLFAVGTLAVLIGFSFVGAGGYLFQKVTFNIFPPSKDTNGLTVQLQFAPGTTITQAQVVVDKADTIVASTLGENLSTASYYSNANEQQARLTANIISYDERDVRSPELQAQLQDKFDGFEGAQVKVGQLDVGPPPSAFSVQIDASDREKAFRLAEDVQKYLQDVRLDRNSGEAARTSDVTVSDPATYSRNEGKPYIAVTANFESTDTTTLVTLAQNAVKKEFSTAKLQSYGLPADAIDYDIGQEQENQDSFKALAVAFPLLLIAIYILLAIQFRSFLQPLLIFMAIPFSLFGITLGLYLTNNPFSFFAMLGFFALVGLSLKNTILLTDYANQLRREGYSAVDAAVGALHERFRPLIATSLTAVVSLIPLAIASPFWEGLSVVLIGGLLSSTFLVITVFPYYYLGAEYLRVKTRRKSRR